MIVSEVQGEFCCYKATSIVSLSPATALAAVEPATARIDEIMTALMNSIATAPFLRRVNGRRLDDDIIATIFK
jgi:hypothetical protein